jgi:myo-inositol-1(or 4)-monophosphatase
MMLDFITAIARESGDLLCNGFRHERKLDYKSRAELVTDIDVASERLIVERIATRYPDHHIITEEGGGREQASPYVWLIDPLDGTNNYAHGVPYFSVSIALLEQDRLIAGVVYDPLHDECFTAEAGSPALLNGQPLSVSTVDDLTHAQLSTGFPYDRWSRPDNNVAAVQAMVMRCQDLRRMGSAALDLCSVAAGRFDGHWEMSLKPWDSAAGALIVQQASGRVTTIGGKPYSPWNPHVVASNGLIHDAMLDVLSTSSSTVL